MAKEVIIIGDGPSIMNYDLGSLDNNVDRIYCGKHIFHRDFNSNPNISCHYIVIEPRLLWPNCMLDRKRSYIKSLKMITNKMMDNFRINGSVNYYLHWTNIPFIRNLKNLTFISNRRVPGTTYLEQITGSFDACISLADHLGYTKVHLLGFDGFVLEESYNNRWYEKNEKKFKPDTSRTVKFLIDKFDHIRFYVVAESKLIFDSKKLLKSDIRINSCKNRVQLRDVMREGDIKTLASSKYLNVDI
jgi:hypothetical protein